MPTSTVSPEKEKEIKSFVSERYAKAISTPGSGCCGTANAAHSAMANDNVMMQTIGYTAEELKVIPQDAAVNSFGCGNPLSMAEVQPGQVVVDIGSGAGIDCFIAAQKVGPAGRVIGVDMTPAMLERARANALQAGLTNVEFRQGDAEALPMENNSVDWVISNCVINLAPDKKKVFREIVRVLKPGGRISVSDIVVGDLPWWVKRSKSFYASCLSGALHEEDYLEAIRAAGLQEVNVTARFVYDENSIQGFCCGESVLNNFIGKWFVKPIARRLGGQVTSIKVSALKP